MLPPAMGIASPLPSSTLILLREEPAAGEPFSVLMLERHGSITFPGAHAFPGGVLEEHADADAPGASLPASQRWAPSGEGDAPTEALPYWIAAMRELFEELGILLARRDGRLLEEPLGSAHTALRARVLAGEPFAAVLAEAGLVPATDELYYLARWITPIANPRRFDTRFLVGRMPAGQEALRRRDRDGELRLVHAACRAHGLSGGPYRAHPADGPDARRPLPFSLGRRRARRRGAARGTRRDARAGPGRDADRHPLPRQHRERRSSPRAGSSCATGAGDRPTIDAHGSAWWLLVSRAAGRSPGRRPRSEPGPPDDSREHAPASGLLLPASGLLRQA